MCLRCNIFHYPCANMKFSKLWYLNLFRCFYKFYQVIQHLTNQLTIRIFDIYQKICEQELILTLFTQSRKVFRRIPLRITFELIVTWILASLTQKLVQNLYRFIIFKMNRKLNCNCSTGWIKTEINNSLTLK